MIHKRESDNSNQLTIYVSPSVQPLLQVFKDVFPKEIPHGLPPSRSIEHQVEYFGYLKVWQAEKLTLQNWLSKKPKRKIVQLYQIVSLEN